MKNPDPREAVDTPTQGSVDQPEPEPTELMDIDDGNFDDPNQVDDEAEHALEEDPDDPDEPLPEKQWPKLAEYMAKWDAGLAQHSRENTGPFSLDNLVPEPISQLWQDALCLAR